MAILLNLVKSDSSHRVCSVGFITRIDVLSCRPISSWAGEYPHSSDVVRYANSAPYGSTDFFSIALMVCTVRPALPLLCSEGNVGY